MHDFRILFSTILLVSAPVTLAQTAGVTQAELLGDYFGFARGITAALAVTSIPTQVEKDSDRPGHSAQTERRTYVSNGAIVKVLSAPNSNVFDPISVELTTPEAIHAFSKNLSELTKTSVIPNLGEPESKTQNGFKYLGPAEICSEYLELTYRGEKLSSVKWSFCRD